MISAVPSSLQRGKALQVADDTTIFAALLLGQMSINKVGNSYIYEEERDNSTSQGLETRVSIESQILENRGRKATFEDDVW